MKAFIRKTIFFIFFLAPLVVFGQVQVEGIVFDKATNQRIAEVLVWNARTSEKVYNNSRGEFRMQIKEGDTIFAEKKGFYKDSLRFTGEKVLLIFLDRSMRYIPEVTVHAKQSPEVLLDQAKKDYKKAFDLAAPGDLLSVGATGAGLNINTIYNLFSKEGKNAKRLTKTIEREYQENVIDSKFTPSLVQSVTGLKDKELSRFMQRYRPSYLFIVSANEYQLIEYVKSKYEMFKLTPELRNLSVLPKLELKEKNKEE